MFVFAVRVCKILVCCMQLSDEQLKPPSKPAVEELVIRYKGVCCILSTNSNEIFMRNSYPIIQPIENFNGSHFEASGGKGVVFESLFNPA